MHSPRHFEYLLALHEYGSFKRAALELHVSQPALSKGIATLEREVGHPLFNRGVHPLRPTDTGKLVIEEAQRCIEGGRRLREKILQLHGVVSGHLRVAFGPYAGAVLAPGFALRFHQRFPASELELRTDRWDLLPGLLRSGRVDLFVGDVENPALEREFEVIPVIQEKVACFCAPNHPVAGLEKPTLKAIFGHPLVLCSAPEWARQWLRRSMPDSDPRDSPAVIRTEDFRMIRDILLDGTHATFGFPSFFRPDVEAGRLVHLKLANAPVTRAGMALGKGTVRSPELDGAIEILRGARTWASQAPGS